MTPIEELTQLLTDKRTQRILAPDLIFGLISAAEEGNEKPLVAVIALLKEKLPVLESIDAKFEKTMNDIMKDFEVGVATIKADERKKMLGDLKEREKMEKQNLEEALNKSLKNT